jgi:hypothetical protein
MIQTVGSEMITLTESSIHNMGAVPMCLIEPRQRDLNDFGFLKILVLRNGYHFCYVLAIFQL